MGHYIYLNCFELVFKTELTKDTTGFNQIWDMINTPCESTMTVYTVYKPTFCHTLKHPPPTHWEVSLPWRQDSGLQSHDVTRVGPQVEVESIARRGRARVHPRAWSMPWRPSEKNQKWDTLETNTSPLKMTLPQMDPNRLLTIHFQVISLREIICFGSWMSLAA